MLHLLEAYVYREVPSTVAADIFLDVSVLVMPYAVSEYVLRSTVEAVAGPRNRVDYLMGGLLFFYLLSYGGGELDGPDVLALHVAVGVVGA